jgi:hypothetical protein
VCDDSVKVYRATPDVESPQTRTRHNVDIDRLHPTAGHKAQNSDVVVLLEAKGGQKVDRQHFAPSFLK